MATTPTAQQYGSYPIDRGEIDEPWIFGAPYLGFWSPPWRPGRGDQGGVYDSVPSAAVPIMGFSYERGRNAGLCHRTKRP
jgi:hypothetical protein